MRGSTHGSATASALVRFLRSSPLGVVAAVLVVVAVVVAIFAAQVAPYDPLHNDYTAARQSPSAQHLLGTDNLGRDVLSRIIYGLRVSLIVSVASILLGVSVGVVWGVTSGYAAGAYDLLSQRLIEVLSSFPTLILAMLLSVGLGPGLGTAIFAEAALSFLGVGVPPPTPSLGNMLGGVLAQSFQPPWWLVIFPGAAIALTVLAANLLGDTLRDFLDPKLIARLG